MKKLVSVFLTICLLASLAVCFTVSANAAEEVTVGKEYAWNDQSTTPAAAVKWRNGGGKSPDGLWKYEIYHLATEKFYGVVLHSAGGQYAWNATAGADDHGMGYARVREVGKNFHPAYGADIVKTFICPEGGTIDITSTVARAEAVPGGSELNGTSFAIYVEDRRVYPAEGEGEYLTLDSTAEKTVEVKAVEVAKNERVRIHIGAIGNQEKDEVSMSNIIIYKSLNSDNVADIPTDVNTDTNTDTDESSSGDNWWDKPDNGKDKNSDKNNNNNAGSNEDGLSAGAIIGIVIGAVAVVGIAVAVVIVLKKKKQD